MTYIQTKEHAIEIRFPHLASDTRLPHPQSLAIRALSSFDPGAVSTLGWDTVFSVRLKHVNEVLAKSKDVPKTFSLSGTGTAPSANGKFVNWTMENSGSGSLVHLGMHIETGTINFNNKTYALDGATMVVEIRLDLLPHSTQPPNPASGTTDDLKMALAKSSANPNPVTLVRIEDLPGESDLKSWEKYAIMGILQDWLAANSAQVTHIFALININNQLAKDDGYQWLRPTYTSYAMIGGADDEHAALAVLNMTTSESGEGLPQQVSPGAIPSNGQAGFLISKGLFFKNMLLPVLPAAFKQGTTVDNFSYDSHFNSITKNSSQDLKLDDVKYGAINYTPYVTKFELSLESGTIKLHTEIHVNISPGIDLYVSTTAYNTLTLDPATQKLIQVKVRDPDTDHRVELAPGLEITAAVLAIVGAIVGVVVGVVLKGAQAIIVGIIVALCFGLTAAVVALIKSITGEELAKRVPTIDLLATSATSTIQWNGGKDFKLVSASLQECFQFGGTLFPGVAPLSPTSRLLAYWPFREDGSDQSGNGRNGQLVEGARIVANARGRAGALALVPGAYVRIPRVDISKTDFTVACWVNLTSTANRNVLFGDWVSLWQFLFAVNAGGAVTANLRKNTNDFSGSNPDHDLVILSSTARVPAGQWCHIAITWDRAARQCTAYINGASAGSVTTGPPEYPNLDLQQNSHDHYCIGHKEDGSDPSAWFNGSLSEFRIYSRALAPDELHALHDA